MSDKYNLIDSMNHICTRMLYNLFKIPYLINDFIHVSIFKYNMKYVNPSSFIGGGVYKFPKDLFSDLNFFTKCLHEDWSITTHYNISPILPIGTHNVAYFCSLGKDDTETYKTIANICLNSLITNISYLDTDNKNTKIYRVLFIRSRKNDDIPAIPK